MPPRLFNLNDLFSIFRAPSITTLVELTEFTASRAAFIAQKCTIDYCQARTGPMWSKLETEPAFLQGLERARWEAYPLVLSDMAIMVEGILRPNLNSLSQQALANYVEHCFASALDRYPPPVHRGSGANWSGEHAAFRARLGRAQLAAPKPVHELGAETGYSLHDLAPIHPDHKRYDRAMIATSVKMRLARSHEDLLKRLDMVAVIADLARHWSPR